MKLLFIRHGDPDYEHDTLTEKGHREAALLAEKLCKIPIDEFYMSPLGRAQDTAAYTLNKLGKKADVLEWLREFPAKLDINGSEELVKAYPDTFVEKGVRNEEGGTVYQKRIVWDMLPAFWTEHPEFFEREGWRNSIVSAHSDMEIVYDRVTSGLDYFLAEHGYVREGSHYRVEQGNEKTIAFFCHFGVTSVLLSHLWSISPMITLHSFAMAPTSVTELASEERQKGCAYFRGLRIGDISHLYMGGEEPSFSARFCETYENTSQRH